MEYDVEIAYKGYDGGQSQTLRNVTSIKELNTSFDQGIEVSFKDFILKPNTGYQIIHHHPISGAISSDNTEKKDDSITTTFLSNEVIFAEIKPAIRFGN